MTLQEQIDRYRDIAQDAPYSGMAWEIITKQAEMLKVAKEALLSCRLFAGCEREYDEQLVEEALAAMESEKSCK